MPSFSDILTKTAESVERPPLPPKGTYVLVITGQPKKTDRKEYEILEFSLKGVRPDANAADVDMEELQKYGAASNIICRKSFLFNTTDEAQFKQTEYNLRQFFESHLKLDPTLTMKELMNAAVGKQCLGYIDYRPDQENPEVMYVDLKRTAPLEA